MILVSINQTIHCIVCTRSRTQHLLQFLTAIGQANGLLCSRTNCHSTLLLYLFHKVVEEHAINILCSKLLALRVNHFTLTSIHTNHIHIRETTSLINKQNMAISLCWKLGRILQTETITKHHLTTPYLLECLRLVGICYNDFLETSKMGSIND